MIYKVKFTPISQKEWQKIDSPIRDQFKKKLEKIVQNPHIPKNRLSGYANIYKIKLRSAGFRLVYEVKEKEIVVLVLAVGKRENDEAYKNLENRSSE